MMGYDTLANYYQTIFALVHHHKWDASWIENMIPYEKHAYLDMLGAHIAQQDEMRRDHEAAANYQAQKGRR